MIVIADFETGSETKAMTFKKHPNHAFIFIYTQEEKIIQLFVQWSYLSSFVHLQLLIQF